MLGEHVRKLGDTAAPGVASTRFYEAVKEGWVEQSSVFDVTLERQDPIWKEWWIGASSIHKMCPRMYAKMAAARGAFVGELFKADTLWNFGQGHAYHDLFQKKIMTHLQGGTMLGKWERTVTSITGNSMPGSYPSFRKEETHYQNDVPEGVSVERGWGPRPDGDGWTYSETKFRIPALRLVVKLDGIVKWDNLDELEIIEIKTEKSQAKDALNPLTGGAPRKHHIEQVHVGMLATGLKRGRIIYVFKGEHNMALSIVEYVIHRDERIIGGIRKRARECVEAVRHMDDARDATIKSITGEEDLIWDDVSGDSRDQIRASMLKEADRYSKLEECQWKSKGRPRYCPGRDLCFGVRKKKKKVVK